MKDPEGLITALHNLLGPGIGVGVIDPKAPDGDLWPEEASAIAKAIPKRQLEFTAGRVAARRAMAGLGLPPAPILMARDRAPVWPPGLVGSISHCDTACVAAVAPVALLHSIGIDIETAIPLAPELWDIVLSPSEYIWLKQQPAVTRGILAKRIFSAKEAVYKAQYPLTGQMIGFGAVAITPNPDASTFTATFTLPYLPPLPNGRFTKVATLLLSCLVMKKYPKG